MCTKITISLCPKFPAPNFVHLLSLSSLISPALIAYFIEVQILLPVNFRRIFEKKELLKDKNYVIFEPGLRLAILSIFDNKDRFCTSFSVVAFLSAFKISLWFRLERASRTRSMSPSSRHSPPHMWTISETVDAAHVINSSSSLTGSIFAKIKFIVSVIGRQNLSR